MDAIPLKGAALLLRGEAAPGLRPMGDLDLLLADPARVADAAAVLARRTPYRPLLDTPRHLVLAEEDERVPSPAGEHPENPLRIELHRSFRLPVLGVVLDATGSSRPTRRGCPWVSACRPGTRCSAISGTTPRRTSRRRGCAASRPSTSSTGRARSGRSARTFLADDAHAAAPLLYAADGLERLFPGIFDAASLARLAARVPPHLRARAATLPVLRHSRPARGFHAVALSLTPTGAQRLRFLFRTAFPTLGEVKANFAPEADGAALGLAWLRVFASPGGRSSSTEPRPRGRDAPVEVLEPGGRPVGVVLPRPGESRLAHPVAHSGVGREGHDRLGERFRVSDRHGEGAHPVSLGDVPNGGAGSRDPAGGRLDESDGACLVKGGDDEDVGRREEPADLVRR